MEYSYIELECRVEVIMYLVKVGVSVNEWSIDGILFFYMVILMNELDIFVVLFDCGVDVM